MVRAAAAVLCLLAANASALDCVSRPELCNRPVVSEVNDPDLAHAIDVVFLGDVDPEALVTGLKSAADAGIVPLTPGLFNFHRVTVAGAGVAFDVASGFPMITYDAAAVMFAAAQNAPDVDVVVLVASVPGRPNAAYPTSHTSGGRCVVSTFDAEIGRTLEHELGHALFHLADEYEDGSFCLNGTFRETDLTLLPYPNVTAAENGGKLTRATAQPLVEGGYYCAKGVWRTAATCTMRAQADAWCPACARHVRVQLDERRQGLDLDAPYAALGRVPARLFAQSRPELVASAVDSLGAAHVELALDGQVLAAGWRSAAAVLVPESHDAGVHVLTASAADDAGHTATVSARFEIDLTPDTTPPSVMFPGPDVVRRGDIVRAEVHDDRDLAPRLFAIADGRVTLPVSSAFDVTMNVDDGRHRLVLRARDAAGNETLLERDVTVVGAAAAPAWVTPAAGAKLSPARVEVELTVPRSVVEVKLFANGVRFLTVEPDGSGAVRAPWDAAAYAGDAVLLSATTRNALGETAHAERVVSVLSQPVRTPAARAELPAAAEPKGCSTTGAGATTWFWALLITAVCASRARSALGAQRLRTQPAEIAHRTAGPPFG